jgi:hypothetical protein
MGVSTTAKIFQISFRTHSKSRRRTYKRLTTAKASISSLRVRPGPYQSASLSSKTKPRLVTISYPFFCSIWSITAKSRKGMPSFSFSLAMEAVKGLQWAGMWITRWWKQYVRMIMHLTGVGIPRKVLVTSLYMAYPSALLVLYC